MVAFRLALTKSFPSRIIPLLPSPYPLFMGMRKKLRNVWKKQRKVDIAARRVNKAKRLTKLAKKAAK